MGVYGRWMKRNRHWFERFLFMSVNNIVMAVIHRGQSSVEILSSTSCYINCDVDTLTKRKKARNLEHERLVWVVVVVCRKERFN